MGLAATTTARKRISGVDLQFGWFLQKYVMSPPDGSVIQAAYCNSGTKCLLNGNLVAQQVSAVFGDPPAHQWYENGFFNLERPELPLSLVFRQLAHLIGGLLAKMDRLR